MLENYQKQRARSLKVQQVLSQHILLNHNQKEAFVNNLTYGEYLKQLQRNHILNLSDKNYVKLKNSTNRLLFRSTAGMLNDQEIKLTEAEKILSKLDSNKTKSEA